MVRCVWIRIAATGLAASAGCLSVINPAHDGVDGTTGEPATSSGVGETSGQTTGDLPGSTTAPLASTGTPALGTTTGATSEGSTGATVSTTTSGSSTTGDPVSDCCLARPGEAGCEQPDVEACVCTRGDDPQEGCCIASWEPACVDAVVNGCGRCPPSEFSCSCDPGCGEPVLPPIDGDFCADNEAAAVTAARTECLATAIDCTCSCACTATGDDGACE